MRCGRLLSRSIYLFAVLLAAAGIARANEPNWPDGQYNYTVVSQDLRNVLERFGENTGMRVSLSDNVRGEVRGTPTNATPKEFLNYIAGAYGLDWYYDGSVLSISAANERQTQSVRLNNVSFDDAQQRLKHDGVWDSRYTVRPGPAPDLAVVAGPPAYVSLVAHEVGSIQVATTAQGQMIIYEGGQAAVYGGPNWLRK